MYKLWSICVALSPVLLACESEDAGPQKPADVRTGFDRLPEAPCCNPAAKPGVGGNPFCIEGTSCCADGNWTCNEGDGSSICQAQGQVCE